jgi:hypothetical protein
MNTENPVFCGAKTPYFGLNLTGGWVVNSSQMERFGPQVGFGFPETPLLASKQWKLCWFPSL